MVDSPVRPVIGIVGDYNGKFPLHPATTDALRHVSPPLGSEWVPTATVEGDPVTRLGGYAGLWIAPGSPYASMAGALAAVRFARERGVPLFAT